ncbi:MAG: type 2 lanthipeptide synthetase LanM, partial [Chlamydiales bacterium]
VYSHSVLRTALLPTFIEKDGQRGPDISGLTAEDCTFKTYKWQNIDTDELTRVEESVTEELQKHRVYLNGTIQNADEYVEEIVRGFKMMYAFVREKKELFVREGGWIDRFAKSPVRMVVRATRLYAYLLDRLTSPQMILHTSEREKELEVLNRLLLEPGLRHLVPLVEEEKRAILQGDVPFFITYPRETHLYSGSHFVLHGCLDGNAYTGAIKRIKEMSDEECEIQQSFIRKAFYAKQAGFHSKEEREMLPSLPLLDDLKREEEVLDEVKAIANSLLTNALRSKNGALGWISLEPNPLYGRFELQPVSDSFYSGKVGIALFLSALYSKTKEEKWKEEALNALRSVRTALGKGHGARLANALGIGGMSGAGSVIYGFCKISALLQEPVLIKEASELALSITDRHIEQDKAYDVIAGGAGLILALLTLWEITREQKMMDLALAVGEHLAAKAEETEEGGIGWKQRDGLFMLGFSHGNAGIAYALLRLATLAQKPELFDLVHRAHAHERALFCPDRKNWPRLDSSEIRSFPVQWCHGAVGIGFGRLGAIHLLEDPYLLNEVEAALQKTEENLFLSNNLNLCCGSAGKLEFLRSAHAHFPHVEKTIPRMISSLITHYKNRPPGYFDPSFMQGASGVGYTLLRTLDKEGVLPQVLLME